ncbi:hypothetical protein HY78_19360 [Rhizorhabdus wittichii DC-6]|nr:hypothetical protein HY78_19360 [Rhizorhabdus wittichii DC-6]
MSVRHGSIPAARRAAPAVLPALCVIAAGAIMAVAPAGRARASDAPGPRSAYAVHCAACHGQDFQGGFGPALKGASFVAKWASRMDRLAVHISETMPPSDPGSLPPDAYAGIVAAIARANGLDPAGGAKAAAAKAADASATEVRNLDRPEPNYDRYYEQVVRQRRETLAALRTVSDADLRAPAPGDWLHWRRSYDGAGASPLTQITAANASQLEVAWSLALPNGTNGITPLVHDGVMFVNSSGTVLAIDAASGDPLWTFSRPSPPGLPISQPRSMAIYGDRLYVPTSDNHMLALDMRSGKLLWDHLIASSSGTLMISAGPLAVRGKIIQGMAGCAGVGEPNGCFVVALDAETGKELWRFDTIATGEPDSWNGAPRAERFGASIWATATYDAEDDLILIGTGQTYHIAPLMRKPARAGTTNDALYTNSTLAFDPDTGRLVWFYQHMPREVWDFDWAFERQVIPLRTRTGERRVVATIGKIGILDLLDAKTGAYVGSVDMGFQNLVKAIDPRTGRKITDPALDPDPDRSRFICPFATGVRNWPSTAYDPGRRLIYVPFTLSCMHYSWRKGEGFDIAFGMTPPRADDGNLGGLAAIDPDGMKVKWVRRQRTPSAGSVLATAGGIVAYGARDRIFRVVDGRSGDTLWALKLDQVPSASPISFMAGGVQYLAVTTGGGSPNDVTARALTPEIDAPAGGVRLWAFRLKSDRRSPR